MSDKANFTLKNPSEITRKLNIILKQNSLITVSFNEGQLFFLSTLLDIDTKKQKMSLDFASDDHLNKQILKASKITFETNVGGVAVTFSLDKVSKPMIGGGKAFTLSFPTEMVWLERRSFYRIKAPLQNTPNCKFELLKTDDSGNETAYPCNFELYNLSLSGISFIYDPDQYESDILEGTNTIPKVSITLPEIGRFSTDLNIKHQHPQKISEPDKVQIIGAKFKKLPDAIESEIQRYMLLVERAKRSKFQ